MLLPSIHVGRPDCKFIAHLEVTIISIIMKDSSNQNNKTKKSYCYDIKLEEKKCLNLNYNEQ